MSANPMPTEMQCLARRLHESAQKLAVLASDLPAAFAAARGWPLGGDLATMGAEGPDFDLADTARAMQFDASRLEMLADDQADDARQLYSQTMDLVDNCRMARATWCPAGQPAVPANPDAVRLANVVEEGLATMQQVIAAQFPGEKIPGG